MNQPTKPSAVLVLAQAMEAFHRGMHNFIKTKNRNDASRNSRLDKIEERLNALEQRQT